MPCKLPWSTPETLAAIIAEVEAKQLATTPLERGVLRNCVAKAQRAERDSLLGELNRMAPADLAKINAAASRVERQQDLLSAHVALTKLQLNRIEQRRDLRALRQYFSGR
jgi:hypothetical protein